MSVEAAAVAEKLNGTDKKILTVACFGHFICHFNMLVFPAVLLPLSARLGMEMGQVLGLSFWMYLLYGLTALPWGYASDRLGALPCLRLFFTGAGLSGLAAAYWVDSPTGLMVSLTSLGLFSGIYHPAGLGWISKEIKRISIGLAYNGMFGNLGLAAAPLMAGIVNWTWGPRAVFIFLGAFNLLGAVLSLGFSKSETENKSSGNAMEDDNSAKGFFILCIAMMLGGIAYRGSSVILPAYFELKNSQLFEWLSMTSGMELSENLVATTVTSIIYLLGMLGQYTGGKVGERFDLKYSYLAFHLIATPAVFLMAVFSNTPLLFFALIYLFFLLGMQPIENTLVARFTPKKFHHSAFGVKFVLTFGIGALSVKVVEIIERQLGIETVFTALGFVSIVLVSVILLMIWKTPALKNHRT